MLQPKSYFDRIEVLLSQVEETSSNKVKLKKLEETLYVLRENWDKLIEENKQRTVQLIQLQHKLAVRGEMKDPQLQHLPWQNSNVQRTPVKKKKRNKPKVN